MIYKYNFCIITYIFLYAFMHIVQVTIGYTRNAHHIESGNKEAWMTVFWCSLSS